MSQASSIIRRPRRRRVLRQWLRNLGRLPLWTAVGLHRWLEPGFWLEREARRSVRRWLSRERCRQLERTAGGLAPRYGILLAYLAARAPAGGDMLHMGSWESQATAWMTEGVRQRSDRPQIVSIEAQDPDSWQAAPDHVQRIDAQAHRVKIHRTRLQNIGASFGRPIALLWMDGCTSAWESCRLLERFLPHVTRGGWVVCLVPQLPAAARTRAAIGRRLARGEQFRRIATLGQIEIFRREP
ncbi:MAG TPA: class I SAM-dependent methyltransferase [Pirellulales bacterium]|nr:class I SAM-dependent methyltransferase [Pirellulales bacterium]